ncbi:MAG: TenA family transcriptional regulator [Alphaproteobacteria bacterium]
MFWQDLRSEILTHPVSEHPITNAIASGTAKRATIAELCAQLKYCVIDGIGSLGLIIPQVPRELKRELAGNIFGELHGTRKVPSHWELALDSGVAAGFSREDIDARPMMAETKVYPDTVSAYAARGKWLEALCFVALGAEDPFPVFCAKMTTALKAHYGYDDRQAMYFSVHVAADEEHAETGWSFAAQNATTAEARASVRRAALEGRNMWWNMYSAVYEKTEGNKAEWLRYQA